MNKQLSDCSLEELGESPFNLYVYAVSVLKGPLPPQQHELMVRLRDRSSDEYVRGYFKFLAKRGTIWGRIKAALGLQDGRF